jgi:hypothetical protein
MMTMLVATLGLLPAAMSHGIGSDSQRPFAIVIVGGLISDLVMSIFLLGDSQAGGGGGGQRVARAGVGPGDQPREEREIDRHSRWELACRSGRRRRC